jgi:hypothetical protein
MIAVEKAAILTSQYNFRYCKKIAETKIMMCIANDTKELGDYWVEVEKEIINLEIKSIKQKKIDYIKERDIKKKNK